MKIKVAFSISLLNGTGLSSSLTRRGATGTTGFSNFSFDDAVVCNSLVETVRSIPQECSGFLEIDTAEFCHVGRTDSVGTIESDFSKIAEVDFSETDTTLFFGDEKSNIAKGTLVSTD